MTAPVKPQIVVVGQECDQFAESVVESAVFDRLTAIQTGEDCRKYLQEFPVQAVIVLPELEDVSPLNLVAAIKRDIKAGKTANCSIVFMGDGTFNGSLSSRASVAGVNQIISDSEVLSCLNQLSATPVAEVQVASSDQDLIDDLDEAEPITPEPVKAPKPKVERRQNSAIAVVSAAGGVGRTTCAVLLAGALNRRGLRVALVDLDLQFGDIHHLFGDADFPRVDELAAAVTNPDAFSRIVGSGKQDVFGDVKVFTAPAKPEDADGILAAAPQVVSMIAERFDLCIVDMGSHWSEMSAEVLSSCGLMLGVCDQRATSMATMAKMLRLASCIGVPLACQHVLLNRFDNKAPFDPVGAQMTLKGPKVTALSEGGKEVDELLGLGCPDDLFALKNPLARDITKFADGLLNRLGIAREELDEQPADQKVRGRLSKRFLKGGRS